MSHTSCGVNSHSIVLLNVEELLAGSRHHIENLNGNNETRTQKHLVRERTLNTLRKTGQMIEQCREYLFVWCI